MTSRDDAQLRPDDEIEADLAMMRAENWLDQERLHATVVRLLHDVEPLRQRIAQVRRDTLNEAIDVFTHKLRNEIGHAFFNGHVMRDVQGVAPGEAVPAVRVSSIEAAIEGALRELRDEADQ